MAKNRGARLGWMWILVAIPAMTLGWGVFLDSRDLRYDRAARAHAAAQLDGLFETIESVDDAVVRIQLGLYLARLEQCVARHRGPRTPAPLSVTARAQARKAGWTMGVDPARIDLAVEEAGQRCHRELLDQVALVAPEGAMALAAGLEAVGVRVPQVGTARPARNRHTQAALPTFRDAGTDWEISP